MRSVVPHACVHSKYEIDQQREQHQFECEGVVAECVAHRVVSVCARLFLHVANAAGQTSPACADAIVHVLSWRAGWWCRCANGAHGVACWGASGDGVRGANAARNAVRAAEIMINRANRVISARRVGVVRVSVRSCWTGYTLISRFIVLHRA